MKTHYEPHTGKWITEFTVAGQREQAAGKTAAESIRIACQRISEIAGIVLAMTDYLTEGLFA